MPSSSTRTTHLERHIQHLFRQTYFRLYHANEDRTNAILLQHYADVLEMPGPELLANYLRPSHDRRVQSAGDFASEEASWKAFVAGVEKAEWKWKMAGVVECLHDVGTALKVVGREREAGRWWEMSEDVRRFYDV
ncbi:hypothetical protein B0A55_04917 [Friedmanniomyces simplex]|uniref:Uncharacterized protein n=1 Tax=Friedmanniomyces simplex TaxID=329884 RepID=A0A4U0XL14_9PEZI|nr:hypothetical protein B0A55_04917 [Friedmanniomyces simplex]